MVPHTLTFSYERLWNFFKSHILPLERNDNFFVTYLVIGWSLKFLLIQRIQIFLQSHTLIERALEFFQAPQTIQVL